MSRGELHMVPGLGAIARHGEALLPRRHELDRPSDAPRGDRDQGGALRQEAFGSERTPDIGADDAYAFGVDAGPQRIGMPVEVELQKTGGALGVVPNIMLVSIALAIAGQIVLGRTRFGRVVYAIGSNLRAAALSGLAVRRETVLVYVMSGVLSAVGGILLTAYVNSALPTAGENYELDSIAAVVIGGGSLFGGQGTVGASMLGVLLIGVLNNGTDLLGLSNYAQTVILGCVVIGAVFVDSFRKRVAV